MNNEKGFTLVEMLVVINFSFLLITAIVSLYLLTNKYFISTTKRFEERETTLDFFYKLDEYLKKTDHYYFAVCSDTLQIYSPRDTTIFQKDKISSKILPGINNVKSLSAKLTFLSGKEFLYAVNEPLALINPGEKYLFSSDSITAVSFTVERDKKYSINILNNSTPYKLFRNM